MICPEFAMAAVATSNRREIHHSNGMRLKMYVISLISSVVFEILGHGYSLFTKQYTLNVFHNVLIHVFITSTGVLS